MRLWHTDLIHYLPRQQLLGQHRECCALRGNGWGRKHATVDFVFKHPISYLVAYHRAVMFEMRLRGYHHNVAWLFNDYRGKHFLGKIEEVNIPDLPGSIYPEMDNKYFWRDVADLEKRGCKHLFLEQSNSKQHISMIDNEDRKAD